MESLKPIEPGCLARIINRHSAIDGETVTVVDKIHGDLPNVCVGENHWVEYTNGPYWRIDTEFPMTSLVDGKATRHAILRNIVRQSSLMRIDGHEPDEHDVIIRTKDYENST